ncbi:MAG: hypothetical protein MJE68_09025, partial [Proteobacteria bacterium]|nr:hypothetical protein [Pseudomonadota bacterium]
SKTPMQDIYDIISDKCSTDEKGQNTYCGIPMSKAVIFHLLKQPRREQSQAEVHTSCKTDDTSRQLQTTNEVFEVATEDISIVIPENSGEGMWDDAQYDEEGNIVGFGNYPEVNIKIPRSAITAAQERASLKRKAREEDESAAVVRIEVAEEVAQSVSNEDETEQLQEEGRRPSKRKKAGQDEHTLPQPQTEAVSASNQDEAAEMETKPGTLKSFPSEMLIVTIPQNIDTSKIPPPVPEGE